MFGRRKREEAAAAEAVREAERRELFAKLAQRPEHICPFLGLAADRAGYVDGVSDEHRCFAFGEPAALSAEQQTRVCQERGYGNCPRYLRGVLVIPTEELEALRRPRPAEPIVASTPAATAEPARSRRRRGPLVAVLVVLLLAVLGAGAWAMLGGLRGFGIGVEASATAEPSASASASSAPSVAASAPASVAASGTPLPTPTPEPTPEIGDAFAFYEVSVGPEAYRLFGLAADGTVTDTRLLEFEGYSFAEADAVEGADGAVYWVTAQGDLAGYAYRAPDSGPFRIRAVFLSAEGERRSIYLEDDQLDAIPSAEPTPPA